MEKALKEAEQQAEDFFAITELRKKVEQIRLEEELLKRVEEEVRIFATTELSKEVAQVKQTFSKSLYVTLDSKRRIATKAHSNEDATKDKANDMRIFSAKTQQLVEKEEYYRYYDNPYQYHNNSEHFLIHAVPRIQDDDHSAI